MHCPLCTFNSLAHKLILSYLTSTKFRPLQYVFCHLSTSTVTSSTLHLPYLIPFTMPPWPPEHMDNETHLLPPAVHPPLTHLFSQYDKCDLRSVVGREQRPGLAALLCSGSVKFTDITTLILHCHQRKINQYSPILCVR